MSLAGERFRAVTDARYLSLDGINVSLLELLSPLISGFLRLPERLGVTFAAEVLV